MQNAVGGTHLRGRPIVLAVALFLLLSLLVIVPANPARAATFAVDSTSDVAGSGDLTDGNCGVGPGTCTLRAAIEEANGTAGADEITLAAATYTLSVSGAAEDAAATGDLDITSDVTINGASGGTTIDADTIDRVFHVLSGGSLTLNDVTITGGSAATGAGIQVDAGGTLDLNNATLTANNATGHGGAIHATGDVTADLSTISGNTAAGDGGGLYSAGGAHTLTSVTVAFNDADNGGGLAQSAGTVTIGHTILSNNTASTSGNQCSGTVGTSDYNVIAAIAGCAITPAANDSTGTAGGLVALADNGGPTQTHALNGTSVALDVGGTCSAEDQRGITRGASCDAGAFEAIQVEFAAAAASRAEDAGTYDVSVTIDGRNPHAATTVTVGQTGGTATLGTDYAFAATPVTFPPGTTAPQSASVTITDDDFGEGDETAIFGLSGATGAVLGSTVTHTLTIADNEAVGITVTPTALTVGEGGSNSYQIVLDSEPTADVTVVFNDGTEADADLPSVLFAAGPTGNWGTPVDVTVSVPDNLVADGTRADSISHTVTSTDGDYAGLDPTLPVTINDDDAEAIFITESDGGTTVSEASPGATDTYSVVLGSAPVGTVVITPTFDASQVQVTPSSLSFTAADYDTARDFTVTVVDDDVNEPSPHVSTITHSVTAGSDPAYAAITPNPVAVDITDDDVPGITLTPPSLTVAENAFNTYQIVLDSEPTADVTVVFNDGTEADAGFSSVTFTAGPTGNWDTVRNVVVSVPDNAVADGTRADEITHTVTSTDGDYSGLDPTVSVSITDDDGLPQVDILDVTQVETDGTTTFTFDVSVSPLSASPITLTYSTVPAGIDPADPGEYESITDAQLIIPPLTATDTIEIEVYGDDLDEDEERFRVNAVSVVGGELAPSSQGLGFVTDDDDTPVADADGYNVDEGATLNVDAPGGVLNGDTDGDSGTLNAVLVTPPSNHSGVFTLNADGSFTYVNNGDDGTDSFTYRASDGTNLSPPATVTINVSNVDPLVSINEDPGTGPEGTQIDLTSTVSDPGNDVISRSWSVTKDGGAFASDTGPSFSFTPDDDGTYVVTVIASDGDGGSGSDAITIVVSNVDPLVSINEDPGTGPEGTRIDLTSTVVDPGADPIARSWSVTKDGGAFASDTGPFFSFTPDDDGTYVVTVVATDGDGGNDSDSITIAGTNVDPSVSINQDPGTGTEGTPIALTSTVSDPGSADTFTRSWSVTKDGGAFDSGTGFAYTLTPDDDGTYVVTVTATDDDGGSGSDAVTIVVSNADPLVSINEDPGTGPEGTQIDLTSTVSDPGSADTFTRSWSVTKDGGAFASDTGPSFSLTPDDDGTYVVTVTATDDDGGSGSDNITINVSNVDPLVSINEDPGTGPEGTQIDLTSTVSDPGNDVISRSWSVTKDGVPFSNGTGPAYSFTPDDNGIYVVTVVATDGDGGSDSATATIDVTNEAPTASIDGPDPLASPEGAEVDLTATVNDPGNDALTLSWTVTKDGVLFAVGSGATFSFTPDDNATYVVTLDVDDSEGGTASDSMRVDATNVNPLVPAPPGDSLNEGGIFTLSAPFTDAGQAETHTAVVDWGDGTPEEDCSVSPNCDLTQSNGLSGEVTGTHTYTDDGPFTVSVTVSDGIGSESGVTTVDVANVAPVILEPTDDTITEGDTYAFPGAFTDPGAGDEWSAEVNYGDGSGWQLLTLSGMTFALEHLYVDDGVFDVEVCVVDDDQLVTTPHDDGTCAVTPAEVTVLNAAPEVSARDDADIDEGVTVLLTGATPTSFTDVGTIDTHTATVDWGEGDGPVRATVNPDNTISGEHQYDVPGFYTVTVTVTDEADLLSVGSDTFTVNVRNLDFQVNVSGPTSRNEGGNLSINGDFTDSDGAGTYELVVDWGDGSDPETITHIPGEPGEGTFTAGPHQYADDSDCVSAPGSCTLVVTVDDVDDVQDDAQNGYTVTVNNKVPTTAIAGPTTSPEGTGVKLFGNPKDVYADTLSYEWTVTKDTGDGPAVFKTGTFKNIWFLPDDGCATCVYEATYVVTDDDGASTTEVWAVDVTNALPDAQMLDEFGNTLPPVFDGGQEGDTVSLQAVFTDPGAADTHTITWEAKLLDQIIDTGNEATFDFVAPDDGAYFVVLTVTDDDGGADTPGSPLITVSNAPPRITNLVTDPTPAAGTPVALNVFFTDPGIGDNHTVTVDWGDGSPVDTEADVTSPAALSHNFAPGAHRAQICVADDEGAKKCRRIWYNAGAGPASVGADFNGDGIEDMAVGVPGENSAKGAVNVLYGSASGPSVAGDVFYRQGKGGILGSTETGDEFGATLAHGDFNDDGYDDLAIAAPGEALGGKNNAGSVNVLYGSSSGLSTAGDQYWTQDSNSVADSSQVGDRFGESLAVGDFNGDGFADLAIGVPGEDVSGTANAGRVQVLFGGPSKLVAGSSQSWHQGVKGTLDNKQSNDKYGSSLAAGDFDRDGFWDLAIGVPGQVVGGKARAGAVAILPGSVLGLTTEGDQVWNQNKPGIDGIAQSNDRYGTSLAAGRFDGDAFTDLAVGIPLEGVSGLADAGAVSVIYGTGSGLSSAGDQLWHEDSASIFGVAEANDQFGYALAVGDAGNDGYDDLLVGIPNQAVGGDAEAGVVALIRGGGSGLSAVGNQRWHEDRNGTPGSAQPGDHFGAAVGFADVTGDGRDDLIAGIPGQNFTPADVGAVLVARGHSTGGFASSGSKWFHQNLNGIAGDGAQTNDRFGAAL